MRRFGILYSPYFTVETQIKTDGEIYIRYFDHGTCSDNSTWKAKGTAWRRILNRILRKWSSIWTGHIWPWRESNCMVLLTQSRACKIHTTRQISWMAAILVRLSKTSKIQVNSNDITQCYSFAAGKTQNEIRKVRNEYLIFEFISWSNNTYFFNSVRFADILGSYISGNTNLTQDRRTHRYRSKFLYAVFSNPLKFTNISPILTSVYLFLKRE